MGGSQSVSTALLRRCEKTNKATRSGSKFKLFLNCTATKVIQSGAAAEDAAATKARRRGDVVVHAQPAASVAASSGSGGGGDSLSIKCKSVIVALAPQHCTEDKLEMIVMQAFYFNFYFLFIRILFDFIFCLFFL